MANDVLDIQEGAGTFLRRVFADRGVIIGPDDLIAFGDICDDCDEFFEAETTPAFLDRHGVLCDGHRCANPPSR